MKKEVSLKHEEETLQPECALDELIAASIRGAQTRRAAVLDLATLEHVNGGSIRTVTMGLLYA